MSTNSTLSVTNLDFDTIKTDLKKFLQSQTEFSDYDFEGSGLAVIIDLLAYNTYLNNFHTNMAVNETFLDTAQLRKNILSAAKNLGYTPRSKTSAKAILDITVTADANGAAEIIVPKGTKFSTTINSNTFTFSTLQATSATKNSNNEYVISDLEVYEGEPIQQQFTVDKSNPDQSFVIPNEDIDTASLTVKIQESQFDATQTTYSLANNFTEITGNTKCYWLQENIDEKYELVFGDGVVGYDIKNGNIILCDYLISSGDDANKASSFTLDSDISGYTTVSITTDTNAVGGLDRESNNSIRFLAPRLYDAQQRAVTACDYLVLLQNNYTNIDSINVWGGEDANPPDYGRVYIAIKPTTGTVLTETTKAEIKRDILDKLNVVSIEPVFIDPDYTYVIVNSTVKYNSLETTKTLNEVKDVAKTAVINFNTNDLEKFDAYFRFSKMAGQIDDSDTSIKNNETDVIFYKKITPTLSTANTFTLPFNNEIEFKSGFQGSLISTNFSHQSANGDVSNSCYFIDAGTKNANNVGAIEIQRTDPISGANTTIEANTGSVNYSNGYVIINDTFVPTAIEDGGTTIDIKITPENKDFIPLRNQILTITNNDINITMSDDTLISSQKGASFSCRT